GRGRAHLRGRVGAVQRARGLGRHGSPPGTAPRRGDPRRRAAGTGPAVPAVLRPQQPGRPGRGGRARRTAGAGDPAAVRGPAAAGRRLEPVAFALGLRTEYALLAGPGGGGFARRGLGPGSL